MRFEIEGLWMGLAWGCASAGRPSIQLVLRETTGSPQKENRGISLTYQSLAEILRSPLQKLNVIQVHSAQLSPEGHILRIGDPLVQTSIYPLITHLLEPLETRVIVHVNNQTDISLLDPRTNVILAPTPPSSGLVENNYWANLEYLSEDGEILFRVHSETDYRWMKSMLESLNLASRFTVYMTTGSTRISQNVWAKKIIKDGLAVHILPPIPFTAIPLRINKSEQQSKM